MEKPRQVKHTFISEIEHNVEINSNSKGDPLEYEDAMSANATDELCKICDGRIECAPTAILLISLVHTLYGHIGPEPNYFGNNRRSLMKQHLGGPNKEHYKPYPYFDKFPHESKKDGPAEDQMYDFIVVGGGTAGCVLASRLSENRKWRVIFIFYSLKLKKIFVYRMPVVSAELRPVLKSVILHLIEP